jgi:hypothetical protein
VPTSILLPALFLLGGALAPLVPAEPPQDGAEARLAESVVLVPGDPLLQDRVRVVYWPGHEERAQRVIRTLEMNPYLPGIPPEHPSEAVIVLAPDEERWTALTGGRVPHWGAGVAIPSLRRIVLPVFQTPWDGFRAEGRTVRHEWAHLGLHDYLEGLRIPRWFDEGYAQWVSGGGDFQEAWRLRLALAGGGAPPLDSLTLAWPRDRAGAELAYLLSATAVEYLVRESGSRGIELFLARWKESEDFEDAFRRTYGMTTGTFERRWQEYVKRRYGWLLVLGQSAVFWVFLGGALLLLFRIRRRRDRERMAHLRATEPPDLPAYWEPPRHPPIGGFESERRRPGPARESVDPPPPTG